MTKRILELPIHLKNKIVEVANKENMWFCKCPFAYETPYGSCWCNLLEDEFREPNTLYPKSYNLEKECPLKKVE